MKPSSCSKQLKRPMTSPNKVIGPISSAEWYVMKTLYHSIKVAKTDPNGLSLNDRKVAYEEIKRQFV